MNSITKSLAMSATALLLATSCSQSDETAGMVDQPDFKSETGLFDVDALMALGRVSSPQVSPDGSKVLFSISYESVEKNRSNNNLYVIDADSFNLERITRTSKNEAEAVWHADGDEIAFTYPDKKGVRQLWIMDADGSNRHQISEIETGVDGFRFSPDGKRVVLISSVKYARTASDLYPDLPKATGRVVDDLMYKHWDEWVTEIPHPFVAELDGDRLVNVRDIMIDEPYEAPMKPHGGIESIVWTPDSKGIVYVSRKKTGLEYAISTNSDLYHYDIESGKTRNLTEGMMGYDTAPAFSPDGTRLAWLSMERDGYESDKNRLFVMDWATGSKRDLTADWDYTIDEFAWRPDGKALWFIAPHTGVQPVFSIDEATCEVTEVAREVANFRSLCPIDNNTLIVLRQSMLRPNEICRIDNGEVKVLSKVNDKVFDQLTMPTVEERWVPTTDGKQMLVWVLLPPNFDPNKKYPALLYCEGGPQSPMSQFWSYRWNFALMASKGYVVIAPNRRGLPGFGTEWNEQISGDYPGQNMRDYLSAVDHVKQEPWIDTEHIGATGASYGGFSVYWLAGNHDGRFAALLAHAGIFNMEAQYLETEEMWFANWDMGGAYWEKDNHVAQRTFELSPHRFIDRWDTPIMVSHGEYDYRILASQGMMAFNAARLRGIPAEMVIFPDENHWILKPQNAVLWQRLFFRWFDRWLKPDSKQPE